MMRASVAVSAPGRRGLVRGDRARVAAAIRAGRRGSVARRRRAASTAASRDGGSRSGVGGREPSAATLRAGPAAPLHRRVAGRGTARLAAAHRNAGDRAGPTSDLCRWPCPASARRGSAAGCVADRTDRGRAGDAQRAGRIAHGSGRVRSPATIVGGSRCAGSDVLASPARHGDGGGIGRGAGQPAALTREPPGRLTRRSGGSRRGGRRRGCPPCAPRALWRPWPKRAPRPRPPPHRFPPTARSPG